MASMKRPRLRAVQPRPGARLELTFTNGQRYILDLSDALAAYPGLAPLAKGNAFQGATLGDGGWTVEWPALDIQIGADSLLLDALAQTAPDENTRIFISWRSRHRMTLDQAAEALGVSAGASVDTAVAEKQCRAHWRWRALAGRRWSGRLPEVGLARTL